MKKTYRSLFCLLAVLLLSVSVLPSASALFSKKLYYYGVVEGVSRTVEGKVECRGWIDVPEDISQ